MTLKSLTSPIPVTSRGDGPSREMVQLLDEYRREIVALREIVNDHETRITTLEP